MNQTGGGYDKDADREHNKPSTPSPEAVVAALDTLILFIVNRVESWRTGSWDKRSWHP